MSQASASGVPITAASGDLIADRVVAIVRRYVDAHMQHRLTAVATLDELGLCPLDQYFSVPTALEEEWPAIGMFGDEEIEGFRTVDDLVRAVKGKL